MSSKASTTKIPAEREVHQVGHRPARGARAWPTTRRTATSTPSRAAKITRLKDTDGRGHANVYETFCDEWGLSGDYHEYAFMSKFDKDGNLWVLLTLTGSFTSEAPFRGWCLQITPDGKAVPTSSGIRSPGAIGFNEKGEMFYTENQGPWNGADALRFLEPGKFQGHPIGNKWYSLAPNMGPRAGGAQERQPHLHRSPDGSRSTSRRRSFSRTRRSASRRAASSAT